MASVHTVKCKICGESFDTNAIQAVKCGPTRYAHYNCFPEGELYPMQKSEPPEFIELRDYIRDIYGDMANWPVITRQIQKYIKEGKTYSEIKATLKFFYEVQKNPVDKSKGGIGIVQYAYKPALQYWYYQDLIAKAETKRVYYKMPIEKVTIKKPQNYNSNKKLKFFDLGETINGKEE